MRICVVTFHGPTEPRAPRHAMAIKSAFPNAEVYFIYYLAESRNGPCNTISELKNSGVIAQPLFFPTRTSSPFRLVFRKLLNRISEVIYKLTGVITEPFFGVRTIGLTSLLKDMKANIYFAHNYETLMPAAKAAEHHGANLFFDCMEFYSDMGDGQRAVISRAILNIERRYLPLCKLILSASDELANEYARTYQIRMPYPTYNVPCRIVDLPKKKAGGLKLYWRNTVIGFGQRGLEDILCALTLLPSDVHLYLQGYLGFDNGAALKSRISELQIIEQVTILPPYTAGDAVLSAAPYDIGLCLERKGPLNHDLTVSNKLFDYHMAGLAVIAANLPGLASVIHTSRGGILYRPGDVNELVASISALRSDRARLEELQRNARAFALGVANWDVEKKRLTAAFKEAYV